MAETNFETLQVYQLAVKLGDGIWKIVARWERFTKDTIGKQIVRSADSIGANIAEGSGKGTPEDNRRFVRHARGSLYETKHWINRAHHRELLTVEEFEYLESLTSNLVLALNGYMRFLNKSTKSKP
jgi:four helix bundle protein